MVASTSRPTAKSSRGNLDWVLPDDVKVDVVEPKLDVMNRGKERDLPQGLRHRKLRDGGSKGTALGHAPPRKDGDGSDGVCDKAPGSLVDLESEKEVKRGTGSLAKEAVHIVNSVKETPEIKKKARYVSPVELGVLSTDESREGDVEAGSAWARPPVSPAGHPGSEQTRLSSASTAAGVPRRLLASARITLKLSRKKGFRRLQV